MSQEMLATLRRGYEAFNRGDTSVILEVAREVATPDMEWGATGAFPGVEGMYRGPEAMQEWMEVIRSAWEEFEVSLDEDHVIRLAERGLLYEEEIAALAERRAWRHIDTGVEHTDQTAVELYEAVAEALAEAGNLGRRPLSGQWPRPKGLASD